MLPSPSIAGAVFVGMVALTASSFAVLIGIAMGLVAFGVDWGIEALNALKFGATRSSIQGAMRSFWLPAIAFVLMSVGYSIVSGSLVSWGSPLAAGSGIPEIKCYLNGVHIKGAQAVCTVA
jgi:chloride channel 7